MIEHDSAYLAWRAPDTNSWHVVGLLRKRGDNFIFNYTKGCKASDKFIPFSGMTQLDQTYVSKELFPLFANRLLSTKRPEYPKFISWLGLDAEQVSPINVLARSGGMRLTDSLQMFKRIEIADDGTFTHIMFAHGLSHLSASASERVLSLVVGEQLCLCLDVQNSADPFAVIIRAERPSEIVGYCPRYLAQDITKILTDSGSYVKIYVEGLTGDAPANYKLMCKLKGIISASLAKEMSKSEEFDLF